MFENNSRIEQLKGIHFYEQDILYDNHTFTGDIQIQFKADYISPGLGIALIVDEGSSIVEKSVGYLFRVGHKEASAVYRLGETQKLLSRMSNNFSPVKENINFIFKKTGRKITIEIAGIGSVFEHLLQENLDKFNIGIYSNAGNTIKDLAIKSSVPDKWNVNMTNTKGGYLNFLPNGFKFTDCVHPGEIEQQNILLDPGTYFVRFQTESINNQLDIEPFVFLSNDDRLMDDEKNLLQDGYFELSETSNINLKFKGTSGIVKDIQITDKESDDYIASQNGIVIVEGSYLDVLLNELQSVEWKGIIKSVPDQYDSIEKETFSVVSDFQTDLSLIDIGMLMGLEYEFKFNAKTNELTVLQNGKQIYFYTFYDISDRITIFKNVTAIITEMTLIKKDGQKINLIVKKTSKKYVPASINSPILVVDEDGSPLDLSSSYRILNQNNKDLYLFTNYEREVFEPTIRIKTEKPISEENGAIKIYGILKDATITPENLYRIREEGVDSINDYCDQYEIIFESELRYLKRLSGEIFLNDVSSYKQLVVDYLKRDSYCINYKPELKMYEVDISIYNQDSTLIYDFGSDTEDGKVIGQLSDYKVTSIVPTENSYIILRREEF